ncbi:CBS domain-containing protein [Marinobacter daepoensis]|uniref:CBS domain-containing protein n=1 Tax=Marinobacter daepoensis TaxID=262077 RepID=A0ABS3BBQ2_9GAMM|nr:CBS domain-containing protein [Marinobacter daepoensis]MBN7769202.1 CBS domain-containing protein [Marinobacter daepoensis]MBY6032136.1 CBS domain-containing protein [Marinobacter daepoensis]MBY6077892.1 CBS domain-containing protein [Marinobacter daepoensis]
MSIFVSEPGRPIGTRLPEAFRSRRVGDVTELSESAPISPGHSEATDAEFQQAAHSGSFRALQEYGAAAAGERREERVYLPVADISSPAQFSVPASATLAEALDTMEQNRVHHLVVFAENNVAGLIDLRWLLSWVHQYGSDTLNHNLAHIELPAFLTASPETDAHQLARLMLAHRLNAALVIDASGEPEGIVTSTDYLKLYANAGRQEGAV